MRITNKVVAALAAALLLSAADAASAGALQQKLVVPGSQLFGLSVAVDGDTLVVGDPSDANGKGAVFEYTRTGDSWTNTAKLVAADGASGDVLGNSVAIDGDTIVAGAPGHQVGNLASSGAVYTFARTGAAMRTQTAELTAADAATDDRLGSSVAVDGDTIVAGAPNETIDTHAQQGAAYTFTSSGAPARVDSGKLTATDGAAGDLLGTALAIRGATIVVGAPAHQVGDLAGSGAAYTFARTGTPARTQTAELTTSVGVTDQQLGASVAVDANAIVVGAPSDIVRGNAGQGSVYTFALTGRAVRNETARLTSSDGAAGDNLGASVAIGGDTIVAGAPAHTVLANAKQGSAYTFAATGAAARDETARLVDADGSAGALLGFSVAISGNTIVTGAPLNGSAIVSFAPAPPPPPPPPPRPPSPPPSKPVLSGLKVRPSRVHLPVTQRSLRQAKVSFVLSENATVRFTLTKAAPGRLVHGACRSRGSGGHPNSCTRHVTVGAVVRSGRQGANTVPLAGRLAPRKLLAPGSYRLTAIPTDSAHHSGQQRTTRLTVAR